MIISKTLSKKEKLQLAKKVTKPFSNRTIYNSSREIGNPPGITRHHDVFHFSVLRSLLK